MKQLFNKRKHMQKFFFWLFLIFLSPLVAEAKGPIKATIADLEDSLSNFLGKTFNVSGFISDYEYIGFFHYRFLLCEERYSGGICINVRITVEEDFQKEMIRSFKRIKPGQEKFIHITGEVCAPDCSGESIKAKKITVSK